MSLGTWNPADGSETVAYRPDPGILARCARFAATEDWDALPAWVETELPGDAAQMMKLGADAWQASLEPLDEATLLQLLRFFTVAEQRIPHWHGGDKCPVIWISRLLRRRGTALSRDMVLWIRAHSDNRFLPNGPVL